MAFRRRPKMTPPEDVIGDDDDSQGTRGRLVLCWEAGGGGDVTSSRTGFHVHAVDPPEAVEEALDLGLAGIILEVAAENLQRVRQQLRPGSQPGASSRRIGIWKPAVCAPEAG